MRKNNLLKGILLGVCLISVNEIKANAEVFHGVYGDIYFNEPEIVSVNDVNIPTYTHKDRDYSIKNDDFMTRINDNCVDDIKYVENQLKNGEINRIKIGNKQYKIYDKENDKIIVNIIE